MNCSPPSPAISTERSCAEPAVGSKEWFSVLREMRGVMLLIRLVPSASRMSTGASKPTSLIVALLEPVVGADAHLVERDAPERRRSRTRSPGR